MCHYHAAYALIQLKQERLKYLLITAKTRAAAFIGVPLNPGLSEMYRTVLHSFGYFFKDFKLVITLFALLINQNRKFRFVRSHLSLARYI